MKSIVRAALSTALVALAAIGCATMPKIAKGSTAYLQAGMTSPKLEGNEFYMAVGEVDLYRYGLFGNLEPSGKTVEIAAVIQADKATGQAIKIATLQYNADRGARGSDFVNGAAVANGAPYVLDDLRGGISVIDLQPYPRWLDAIDAMRAAIGKLGTYTSFVATDGDQLAPVVAFAVDIGPRWSMGFGGYRRPGWGWGFGRRWR